MPVPRCDPPLILGTRAWHRRWRTGVPALLLALTSGCAGSRPATAPTFSPGRPYVEEGLASWYGEPYHGRTTASGQQYDMWAMTAAHRALPFGTVVRVRRTDTGTETTVTITDRGPFVAGRILDLSRAAAEHLQAIGPGVVPVRLRVQEWGDGMSNHPCWDVQVGAFARVENVDRARRDLERKGHNVRLVSARGGLTRVRIRAVGSRSRAESVAREVQRQYPGALPVPCENP